ncbi:eukaryotic translation initiation factor 3 subunit M [Puccinia sorghi]|uniref:Eukaryotic translation initiation factor 3 subunit M n=1 Tax=Puccinia sorghi TaxID=27349 RepID=A0A0L6UV74_9BASI|nr:eukaryotic translation initiation factor 3 subunit M [Puccinia sorghi]
MAESPFLASANTNTISQGSVWAVLVQPSFPDMVFEASALITKSAPPQSNPTTGAKGFALRMKEAAEAISLANVGPTEKDDSEEGDQLAQDEAIEDREQETQETKEAKRKIVEELWSKLQPSCFAKIDDRVHTGLQISFSRPATNLLLTLMLSFLSHHPDFSRFASQLLEAIATSDGKTTAYGRYNALFTLFNALPAPSAPTENYVPLQLTILSRLVDMAASHLEDLAILLPSLLRLPSYLTQWKLVSSPVGISTIEKVIRLCEQGGRLEDAFNLSILYLSSPDFSKGHRCIDADRVATQAVKLSLTLPNCYDWDLLEDVVPISQYLKSNPEGQATYSKLISLMKSPSTKFDQIEKELTSNAKLQTALPQEVKTLVQKKARLLTLTDLCGSRIGGEVKYSEVKDCLGLTIPIEEDDGMEVEEWVINAIKACLITARLHQPTHVIYVTKASHRSFGAPQWANLQTKLSDWGNSIEHLIRVVEQGLSSVESLSNLKGNQKMISTAA